MRAVDTNVLVRVLTGDDLVQSPMATAFIQAQGPLWISHVVLVETLWVLEAVYGCKKTHLVEALKRLVDNRDVALENPAVVRAALNLYQSKNKLSFDDCMVLEIARQAGHQPLATFDKALGTVEGTLRLGAQ